MRLKGKAGKLYKQYIREGLSEAYARRKASALARGKTMQEARGHKEERLRVRKRGTAKVKVPKSRLEKKKEEWAAYTYQDFLGVDESLESPFSMSSYDHTKTSYKNYDWSGLFAIHQYFERIVADYLKFYYEPANENEGYVDFQEDAKYQHRQFEWKLFDEEGELRYWLVYEKGQITKRQMWEDFDFVDFKINIRELKIWE